MRRSYWTVPLVINSDIEYRLIWHANPVNSQWVVALDEKSPVSGTEPAFLPIVPVLRQ